MVRSAMPSLFVLEGPEFARNTGGEVDTYRAASSETVYDCSTHGRC